MRPAEALAGARRPLAPAAALVTAAGALHTLAYVHTAAWPLVPLAVALLVLMLDGASPRRGALLGWLFGTAWLCAGVWWLFVSMHRYGGLPAPLAAAAVLALSAALSVYLALACAFWARWRRPGLAGALLFAALWLLAELARGRLFTGFPWVASGYALVDSPLAAWAPWLGVYGLGAWLALAGAGLALLWRAPGRPLGRAWGAAALAAVLAAGGALLPAGFTQPAGEIAVTLLQPNVKQDQKFAAERLPGNLAWVARELLAAGQGLVVAPETAVPLLPAQLEEFAPGYLEQLEARFAQPGRAALVGIPLGDFDRGYTNSVIGLGGEGGPGGRYRYDKFHLVPFGEFIPTGFRWFTQMMNIPLGDFARGVTHPPSFAALGQRLAPNICYEDLFGEELARRFVAAATAPTVMVNLSNIGWFGDTVAVPQHLAISRLRSLELERPMIRATNTGATAVIDHQGRVTAALPPHTEGVLRAQVQGREGVTPYAAWAGRFGLWPLGLAAVLLALGVARRPWRAVQPA